MTPGRADTATFPRRYAATQRFTLGAPRSFTVAPGGERVVFVRSQGGDDPVGGLWLLELPAGEERLVCDPRALPGADDAIPAEERARRERTRESAGGIVSYATDREVTRAVFTVGAAAFVADLLTGAVDALDLPSPAVALRLSPNGERTAFVHDRGLWITDGGGARCLARDDDTAVSWGLPEFVAAEEMGRMRGYWWAPGGDRLAVARVDDSPVQTWHIGEPSDPSIAPASHRYPAAGTSNADVSLHLVSADGDATPVSWDRSALPYLVDVRWRAGEPLTVVAQARSQQRLVVMTADDTGATTVVHEQIQRPWIDIADGFPRWTADGRLIHVVDEPATRRIAVDGVAVTPEGVQVRRLVHASRQRLVFTASSADPTAVDVLSCPVDGGEITVVARGGVSDAVVSGDVAVVVQRRLDRPGATATVRHPQGSHRLASHAEVPRLHLNATPLVLGARSLRAMLLLPNGYEPDDGPLPVLLDPYGGPHAQRVLRAHDAHLQSQWFAEAGFAVLVIDGRGTPGRGPAWEQAVAGDLASAPLEDQVDGLLACAEAQPDVLDLDRVAIKGWSFGGYLAALAVLRRPDVFHAAIAGAPVTEWALYDTHYTERYLGRPHENPDAYRATSLLSDAAGLGRPLLLIHGLADDNVVAAHTLQLSRALLEAGRPHCVLPLSGVTHMTPQEVVAENLLRVQLDFLRRSLGAEVGG